MVGATTVLTIPIFTWIILKKTNDEDFNEKYGTLTDETNINSKISKLWNVLMLLKWLLTGVILMTLSSYPSAQVLILLIFSIFYQIIIIYSKPFVLSSNNRLRLVTELLISCYLYFYLLLSDYNYELNSDEIIKYSSWGLIGVLGACATLNIIIYLKIAFL
jgi:hypothetical protein